ncbi:MAG: hypothetical protein KDK39_09390 [Leptospiraceae bacterium]|nr:hypothetical protein [Leptospiraceae bacterium]
MVINFTNLILLILITSLCSSVFTLLLGFVTYRFFLKKSLDETIDEVGDLVKERMQSGVMESATALLPEFRREVSEGFKEALAESLSGDVVQRTANLMAKNSTDLVEQGLNLLLGRKP